MRKICNISNLLLIFAITGKHWRRNGQCRPRPLREFIKVFPLFFTKTKTKKTWTHGQNASLKSTESYGFNILARTFMFILAQVRQNVEREHCNATSTPKNEGYLRLRIHFILYEMANNVWWVNEASLLFSCQANFMINEGLCLTHAVPVHSGLKFLSVIN